MTASVFNILTHGRVQPDLLEQVNVEVALVEEELRHQIDSAVDLVHKVGKHTLDAGGKRLRPAFVGLAAKATGLPYDPIRARKLGTALEMVHMATLIHDDVIDNSATRRGRPTAAQEFGNTASILCGDVLLAKSMMLMARDGDVSLIRTVSEAVVDMAEGEVRELELRGDFDLDEAIHLGVLRLKTASFIECCCEVGGIIAKAEPAVCQALRDYGYHVGMAFQIVDDILDYRGDKAKTGKPIATDFKEGQATLPLIYLRPLLSEAEMTIARRRFGNGVSDDEVRMIVDWMDTRGAFAKAEAEARKHIALALTAVQEISPSPSRDLLSTVAEYVVLRQA